MKGVLTMSEMLRNHMNEAIERYTNPIEKMRRPQEVLARYNQLLMAYRELSFSSGDVRTQKLMTYNEIKVLEKLLYCNFKFCPAQNTKILKFCLISMLTLYIFVIGVVEFKVWSKNSFFTFYFCLRWKIMKLFY